MIGAGYLPQDVVHPLTKAEHEANARELVKARRRIVSTPEGARKYGKPIGTILGGTPKVKAPKKPKVAPKKKATPKAIKVSPKHAASVRTVRAEQKRDSAAKEKLKPGMTPIDELLSDPKKQPRETRKGNGRWAGYYAGGIYSSREEAAAADRKVVSFARGSDDKPAKPKASKKATPGTKAGNAAARESMKVLNRDTNKPFESVDAWVDKQDWPDSVKEKARKMLANRNKNLNPLTPGQWKIWSESMLRTDKSNKDWEASLKKPKAVPKKAAPKKGKPDSTGLSSEDQKRFDTIVERWRTREGYSDDERAEAIKGIYERFGLKPPADPLLRAKRKKK